MFSPPALNQPQAQYAAQHEQSPSRSTSNYHEYSTGVDIRTRARALDRYTYYSILILNDKSEEIATINSVRPMYAPRKRRKGSIVTDSDIDPRQFMILEADVADDSDPENDDATDGEEEFIEDTEPAVANREISHHLLSLEHARAHGADNDWDALLERARARSLPRRESTPDTPGPLAIDPSLRLWRVSVKLGWEETAAFNLMQKSVREENRQWRVSAIIGRVSLPGWIVAEAPQIEDIRILCQGMMNIYSDNIHAINAEDVAFYLTEPPSYTPRYGTWIRLREHPYRGDIAFVFKVEPQNLGAWVVAVPRIPMNPEELKPLNAGKRRRSFRPAQRLFDINQIIPIYGLEALDKRNNCYVFQGNMYMDGYLETRVDYISEEATPTREELAQFEHARRVPSDCIQYQSELIGAKALRPGDAARIIKGEASGAVGIISTIRNNEAEVILSSGNEMLTISTDALRKNMKVGDEVVVAAGEYKGFTGWVVSIVGEMLSVYNPPDAIELSVASHCVDFIEKAIRLRNDQNPLGSTSAIHKHQNPKFVDPNRHLIGRHVRVIRKDRFKDYQGVIKSTEANNFVIVEIQATMRRERLHLSKLTFRDQWAPLAHQLPVQLGAFETGLQFDTPKSFEIPSSVQPLAPSTPLPPALSGESTPAWDPSSRTPNRHSLFPMHPWMEDPQFAEKRIKLQIMGSKPILRDPGFKNGDYEGRLGIWVGIDGNNVRVRIGQGGILLVPSKYVQAVKPEIKGQNVIVIEGGTWRGSEFSIVTFGSGVCTLRHRSGTLDRKFRVTLPTDNLAVVL